MRAGKINYIIIGLDKRRSVCLCFSILFNRIVFENNFCVRSNIFERSLWILFIMLGISSNEAYQSIPCVLFVFKFVVAHLSTVACK